MGYYSCPHGSWTAKEQCPYCDARNESAELDRLRAEYARLRAAGIYAIAVLSKRDDEQSQIAADTLRAAIWPHEQAALRGEGE